MCISSCTILNEVFPVIGIIGIFLILLDYKIFNKKIVKSRNILMALTTIFVIVIILGVTVTFPGPFSYSSCNFFEDIIQCKYLGIMCKKC